MTCRSPVAAAEWGAALPVADPVRVLVAPRIVGFFAEGTASTIAILCALEAERGGRCPVDVCRAAWLVRNADGFAWGGSGGRSG